MRRGSKSTFLSHHAPRTHAGGNASDVATAVAETGTLNGFEESKL